MFWNPRFRNGVKFISAAWLVCAAVQTRADNGWDGHILSFTWENDAVAGSDKHYTQGARISYLSKDNACAGWLDPFLSWFPALGFEPEARKFGLALNQEIYTPEDLRATELLVHDRPYAGWLYATSTLQRRGRMFGDFPVMENVKFDAGVIGPESQAEDTQKSWHGVAPRGWSHQLNTELGFNLRYDRSLLFAFRAKETGWGADIIPFVNASGGNVHCFLGLGSTFRFGYNIPNEFETAHKEEPGKWGFYFFTTPEGRYVLRNIFLDGNTFTDSHSVEKRDLVGDLRIGLTVVLKSVELTAAHTFLTQEFKGQKSTDSYGTAMVTLKF